MAQDRLGRDAVVVTVLSDSNKKYLSTDLMRDEPLKPGLLSPDIEFLGIGAAIRGCDVCLPDPAVQSCG